MLGAAEFRTVVEHAPLVAMDLIVLNDRGEVLLGRRLNRPAQGFWFTPGGRIRKGESLDDAFLRISRDELGVSVPRADVRLLGVFEHFYADSAFAEDIASGTHYVVLAHQLRLDDEAIARLPLEQHDEYRWVDLRTTDLSVHQHVRDYFELS
ncbi:GDP-mannose mannosyl hydrolase [Pseudomonas muyukensis]|uniref:GDP-mannose mannosyl hydrolase n=1 Tax=Pseudomonas muyukensis TaxID=2842357 RepID=A0ABX8MEX1_9PSED|nr:GDP-mannose mannosyl hydrolase [Pseudomonas muyukensis]